jgi:hypothetical protein
MAKMQHAARRAKISAAATTEPMAIPAIAPLDKPLLLAAGTGLLVAEDDGGSADVVGNKVGLRENWGKTTS